MRTVLQPLGATDKCNVKTLKCSIICLHICPNTNCIQKTVHGILNFTEHINSKFTYLLCLSYISIMSVSVAVTQKLWNQTCIDKRLNNVCSLAFCVFLITILMRLQHKALFIRHLQPIIHNFVSMLFSLTFN